MWLFVLFLSVPLIEIALFIEVGGAIGLGKTILVVVATAVLGTFLVRQQGSQVLNDLRTALRALQDPSEPLVHGAMILFSGALLLTPGFFTDAVGLALLVPAVRRSVYRRLANRVVILASRREAASGRRSDPGEQIIEGEFEDLGPPPGRKPLH